MNIVPSSATFFPSQIGPIPPTGRPESTNASVLSHLTDADRALIETATGVKLTPNSTGAPAFAFDIAYDRQSGKLQGPVTPSYVDSLVTAAENSYADQASSVIRDSSSHSAAEMAGKAVDIYKQWAKAALDYFAKNNVGGNTTGIDLYT